MNSSDSRNNGIAMFFDAPGARVDYINELAEALRLHNSDEVRRFMRQYNLSQYDGVSDIIKLLQATFDFLLATDRSPQKNRAQNRIFIRNLNSHLDNLVNELIEAQQNAAMNVTVLAYCKVAVDKRLQELGRAKDPLHEICETKLKGVVLEGSCYRMSSI